MKQEIINNFFLHELNVNNFNLANEAIEVPGRVVGNHCHKRLDEKVQKVEPTEIYDSSTKKLFSNLGHASSILIVQVV